MDEITRRLTGRNKTRWVSKDSIKVVGLTSSIAFIHKISHSNWMPTTQHRFVKRDMVILLFKIDYNIKINLGQLLFDQIIDAQNDKAGSKDLILPNLIYGLLVMQGFKMGQSAYYETRSVHIKIDHRLLTRSHFDDLGAPQVRGLLLKLKGFGTIDNDGHNLDCNVAASSGSASSS
nr:uncharacterized protein LOC109169177 [Ipomoea batatas]